MEKPKFEAFFDPFICEDAKNVHQVQASTTYPQERVDSSLLQSLKQRLLFANSRDLAKIRSTVMAGGQVESQLCNQQREKIFAEKKDTTLFCKLIKNLPVRGLHVEAFIELKKGAKPKKATTLRESWQEAQNSSRHPTKSATFRLVGGVHDLRVVLCTFHRA